MADQLHVSILVIMNLEEEEEEVQNVFIPNTFRPELKLASAKASLRRKRGHTCVFMTPTNSAEA